MVNLIIFHKLELELESDSVVNFALCDGLLF